jgi:prepilin-type N-terminal cleavage/methylation domain-containing protein
MMKTPSTTSRIAGFTLIELIISISIFAFMTILLMAKYGNFSNGVLVTNMAYDVALTVRQAQSFGLNVKESIGYPCLSSDGSFRDTFQCSYGVHFNSNAAAHSQFVFFVDSGDPNSGSIVGQFDLGDHIMNTYQIKKGGYIDKLCVDSTCGSTVGTLDVMYKRPNPNAIIKSGSIPYTYAEIQLKTPDGSSKKVVVRQSGQISIEN